MYQQHVLAVVGLAVLGMLVAPTAANAISDESASGPGTVAPGGSAVFVFDDLPPSVDAITVFTDGPGEGEETVSSATIAVVGGSASARISFPAAGEYLVYASYDGGAVAATPVMVAGTADAALAGEASATAMSTTPFLWFGGGSIVLFAGLIAAIVITRRKETGVVVRPPVARAPVTS